MQLAEVLSPRFVIPSAPRVVALLLAELSRPQPDLRRVVQFINTDPALTTRVLQAANAAFFNLSGQVHCVSEALAILRLGQVQAMVTSAAGFTTPRLVCGLSMTQFWAYSRDCAKVARSLAGLVRQNQQAAYTAGLMHGVGTLAMRAALPQAVALDAEVGPLELKRERLERQAFGFCYTQASAWLAQQWHFPQAIADALQYLTAPFDNDAYEPLAGVVHLAAWRSRARQAGFTQNMMTVTFPGVVAEVLGLDIDMVLQQDPIDWSAQVPGRALLEPIG
ncbi:MAG: HDOD domain-containing protein [Rhodoferax sp.]|jgi:HD-like signal output (HDOD) protein|uniref:HDOD domain-containing protein n=1 Tax=Rhodoferax sp. TaxID=50421 RepID=UPI001B453CAD|nr:HDOD domain-containing protein [Rhodoferax sp.]MBP8287386.1 HDOD domain-containing protein [Rhodoferax sp.]MBP9147212.1 HDOD domain-containing protein [Rhodoferax sp.]MBP9734198.1 HDOD domain-containing protein [Rhodoferax sp.]